MSTPAPVQSQTVVRPTRAAPTNGWLQRTAVNTSPVPEIPPLVAEGLRSPGQPLDPATQSFMESRFGHDFSRVQVHTDAKAAASARAVNALAYTVGQDVVFGAGQYAPHTLFGQRLMAHELTHVMQQGGQGAVYSALALSAIEDPAEREAEQAAEQVLQPGGPSSHVPPTSPAQPAIRRQAAATAAPEAATTAPVAAPAPNPQALTAQREALEKEATEDARSIKRILQERSWLRARYQADIMAIVGKWAAKPLEAPGSRLTAFDFFIAAMRRVTFNVGWPVEQMTSVFDQLFERLSSEPLAQLKSWMQTRGRSFKDEKAIARVKFEVSKEDVLDAVQLAAEVAAAFATGGGSVLAQIVIWLGTTLPGLYQKAKAVLDFVEAIRSLRLDDLRQLVSAQGLGETLVKALFGEVRGLPQPQAAEDDGEAEKEPASGTEEKGLIRVLHFVLRIFHALKRVYGKVAGYVNSALAAVNITTKSWFENFSMAYAAIVKAVQAVSAPGAVLGEAVAKIQETVGGFFKGLRSKVEAGAGDVKARVALIGNPAQLMHLLADKGVEMVLNFIITHPPSALVKLAFKAIETGAKKSILELVREHIPFADKLIKRIAESDTVKKLFQPLQGPIARVTSAIDNVSSRAVGFITNMENQALGLLNSGAGLVTQLTGITAKAPQPTASGGEAQPAAEGPASAEAAANPKPAGDFLTVVKQGIHSRLLEIGSRNLIAKGKQLGQAALEKGKAAVKGAVARVKGLLLGPKVDFEAAGKPHQVWAEEQEGQVLVLVASKEMKLIEKIASYSVAHSKMKDGKAKTKVKELIEKLQKLRGDVEKISEKYAATTMKDALKKKAEALSPIIKETTKPLKELETLVSKQDLGFKFKVPNGATIEVTADWSLFVCNGDRKEIDTYTNHHNKVVGSGLDAHHLLEKRFHEPLRDAFEIKKQKHHLPGTKDEINSVVLPGSKESIKKTIQEDKAAQGLEESPFFHRWLEKADQVFSISKRLQSESVGGISTRKTSKGDIGVKTPEEVLEMHAAVYRELGKPAWIKAIEGYFK